MRRLRGRLPHGRLPRASSSRVASSDGSDGRLQLRREGDVACDAAHAADPDAHGAQSGTFTASQDVRIASASLLCAP